MNYSWSFMLVCDEAVSLLTEALEARGYSVHPSFNLQSARDSLRNPETCSCPHHGTAQCTCQYVVLQVRDYEDLPLSIIAHGHDRETIIALDQSLQLGVNSQAGEMMQDIVSVVTSLSAYQETS